MIHTLKISEILEEAKIHEVIFGMTFESILNINFEVSLDEIMQEPQKMLKIA